MNQSPLLFVMDGNKTHDSKYAEGLYKYKAQILLKNNVLFS